jgi:hypothetical protein
MALIRVEMLTLVPVQIVEPEENGDEQNKSQHQWAQPPPMRKPATRSVIVHVTR